MNKILSKLYVLFFLITLMLIPIKTNAASFEGITEITDSAYIVPYGVEIGINYDKDETITSDDNNICKIDNSGKLQIVGSGKFFLTSKKGDEENKINFFAWNAYLKDGEYNVYSDEARNTLAGKIESRIYFSVSKTNNPESFKIEDHLYTTGKYTGENLDGKYITNYYDEQNDISKSRYYEYALDNKFEEDDDGTPLGQAPLQDDEDPDVIKIKLGKTYTPSSNESLTWSVVNEDVLSLVDKSTGKVQSIRVGSTELVGKTSDGTKKVEYKISVYRDQGQIIPVEKIVLDKTELSLSKDETEKINATIVPNYADNRKISWVTSNNSVATVTTKGRIKTNSCGTATITATTANGAKATCIVKVVEDIKSLKIHFIKQTSNSDVILLESNNHYALIDTGRSNGTTMVPYLKNLKIKKLDFLILTHTHADHRGGLEKVLKNFTVGTIYMKDSPPASYKNNSPDVKTEIEVTDNIKALANKYNVPFVSPSENQVLMLGQMKLTLYNTYQRYAPKTNIGPNGTFDYDKAVYGDDYYIVRPTKTIDRLFRNDNSIVTLVECNGFKTLLTGDLDNHSITQAILNKVGSLDVYKIAHHGMGGFVNNKPKRGSADTELNVKTKYLVATSTIKNAERNKNVRVNGKLVTYVRLKKNGKSVSRNDILWSGEKTVIFNYEGSSVTYKRK